MVCKTLIRNTWMIYGRGYFVVKTKCPKSKSEKNLWMSESPKKNTSDYLPSESLKTHYIAIKNNNCGPNNNIIAVWRIISFLGYKAGFQTFRHLDGRRVRHSFIFGLSALSFGFGAMCSFYYEIDTPNDYCIMVDEAPKLWPWSK